MPLFLKSFDPTVDIFGDTQTFRYNTDQIHNEANLALLNAFTPTSTTNINTGFAFLNPSLNGFRFKHELSPTSIYGNFYLECASRFGVSSNIFKFDEITNTLDFLKPISISGTPVASTYYVNTRIIDSQLSDNIPRTVLQNFNFSSSTAKFGTIFGTNGVLSLEANNPPASGTGALSLDLTKKVVATNIISGYRFKYDYNSNDSDSIKLIKTINGVENSIFGYQSAQDKLYFYQGADMNSRYCSNLGIGTISTDAVNKSQLDSSASSTLTSANTYTNTAVAAISTKSILHGYNISTYATNVNVGDHIKFDGNVFVRGSNISLDTTSSYSASTNVASVGRITLAAGKTYKLTGSINNVVSANYNGMRWYNSDTGASLGVQSGMPSPVSTTDRVPSAGFVAYITTSVSTRVELRITWNALTSVNGSGDGIGPAWFIVEEV